VICATARDRVKLSLQPCSLSQISQEQAQKAKISNIRIQKHRNWRQTAKSYRVLNSQMLLDWHYVYPPAMNMEHFSWQTVAQGRLHSGTWALWLLLRPSQTQGCACASLDPSLWLGTQERNVLLSLYITIYFDLPIRRYWWMLILSGVHSEWQHTRSPNSPFSDINFMFQWNTALFMTSHWQKVTMWSYRNFSNCCQPI
jgi:hypothetical protein